MATSVPSARELFEQALEIPSADERGEFLDVACAGQAELRAKVETLLHAHAAAGSFLATSAIDDPLRTLVPAITEQSGTVIGPYKLLQQIGEGGMGVVFMAEQGAPLARQVAIKIIKPGMDSRQVIARFEAERQALAVMDHPNIAKVFDAGTTPAGRPYFAMELVKGVPITEYCDREHLSIKARLELFVEVCHAVQHAHQKGIIHRDLKPSNVLVAEYDGKPVPKVIDFGVAKATAQKLSDKTMFTEFGQLIGTFEYMSPEQARFNQLDVDTRSDIYSLGVLLYELLTGATPFGRQRLVEAAFDEMLRIIREEEPPRPSTRLSSSDMLPSVAANRSLEPRKLPGLLHGELDWIVMKSLEKDRNRRYETAVGFVNDITRYLNDEPVQACPPSALYRFGKVARRNKGALFVASSALAALLLLVAGLVVSNRKIAAERDEKAQAITEKELAIDLAEAQARITYFKDALQYRSADITPSDIESVYREVTQLLGRATDMPQVPLASGEVRVRERIAHRQRDLAFLVRLVGRPDLAKVAFERSILSFERLQKQAPSKVDYGHFVADTHRQLGRVAVERKLTSEAEREFRRAVVLHEERAKYLPTEQKFLAEEAAAFYDLARLLLSTGRRDEAVLLIARGVKLDPVKGGLPEGLQSQIQLAGLLREAGEVDQAFTLCSEIHELAKGTNPAIKFSLADECFQLAQALRGEGRLVEAEPMYRQAIALREPVGRESSSKVRLAYSTDYNELGFVLSAGKQFKEAEECVRTALAARESLATDFPEDRNFPLHVVNSYLAVGKISIDSGRPEAALEPYGEAALMLSELAAEPAGTSHYEESLRDTFSRMVEAWQRVDRPEDAMRARRKARDRTSMLALESPDNPDYQLELARNERDSDNLEGALTQCAKLIDHNPDLLEAWSIRGDCLVRQGKFDVAEEELTRLIGLHPDRWEAWNGRAVVYFRHEKWTSAAADYSRAIDLTADIHAFWHHRGLCYQELGEWDKASEDFTRAIEGWPHEEDGWYLRAVAYTQLGQTDKAIDDLKQAVARGYKDREQLKSNPKLDSLRSRTDFQKLLAEVEGEAP